MIHTVCIHVPEVVNEYTLDVRAWIQSVFSEGITDLWVEWIPRTRELRGWVETE